MTGSRRGSVRLLAAGLLAVLMMSSVLSGCTGRELGGRSQSLINTERARRGLPELTWNDNAGAKAQAWAEHMAATRTLRHSDLRSGITGNWRTLAENVGYAGSVDAAHAGFMGSSSHRGTILRRDLREVGIGVAERDGVYYVAQVFRG